MGAACVGLWCCIVGFIGVMFKLFWFLRGMRFLLLLVVLLAVFVSAYNVFWGEFVHCDVGT